MGQEVALGAIIEEHQVQSDADIARSLETIVRQVDGAAPDHAGASRSEAALFWTNAADRKCKLLMDAEELASGRWGLYE